MITKEFFQKTISKILKDNHHKHQPCDGQDGWCPACRLFGKVGQSGKDSKAVASRIRFSDSTVIENVKFEAPCFLPILGTPRYSAIEFYLQKPFHRADICTWNYDYCVDKKAYYVDKNAAALSYDAKLKGRKIYWIGEVKSLDVNINESHRGDISETIKKYRLDMTSQVRRLQSGNCSFKVYFEDLTKEELSCLLFCLELEQDAFQRIGRGKPYGMGAVKIEVQKIYSINYQLEDGKITKVDAELDKKNYVLPQKYAAIKNKILKYSRKLEKSDAALVAYPTTSKSDEIFKWFAENRGTISYPEIKQVLSEISDSEKNFIDSYGLNKDREKKNGEKKNGEKKNREKKNGEKKNGEKKNRLKRDGKKTL